MSETANLPPLKMIHLYWLLAIITFHWTMTFSRLGWWYVIDAAVLGIFGEKRVRSFCHQTLLIVFSSKRYKMSNIHVMNVIIMF